MEKMSGKTMNIIEDNIQKLKTIFPEIFNEDKVDFEKLEKVLGNYKDEGIERYDFTWPGKGQARRIAQTQSTGTLRPCKEESKNWDTTENLYIEGDNLEVLKLLQKSYYEKVKMIYIDPPYNTGNDFVYKDDFKDNVENYLKVTGQKDLEGNKVTTNTDSNGRYHSNWLNMMYPRLKLARNLLNDKGIMFISISDHEVNNLKKIMDEIFGESNFIGCIEWNSTKSVTNTALISVSHTHNLVYSKNIEYFKINREKLRLPENNDGFNNPDNDPRGPWKADPFQVGGERPNQLYEIKNPKTGEIYKPNEGCSWKNDYNKFKQLMNDDRIIFGKYGESGPQRKRFLCEALERGRVVKTWWDDVQTTSNGTQRLKKLFDGKNIFNNPKPYELIQKFIQMGTEEDGDIVLDFFGGSGTTAASLINLINKDKIKRKFIVIQIPEKIEKDEKETYEFLKRNNKKLILSEIGKEHIRREGKKLSENLDIGFKVFKLDSSNINKWDPKYSEKLEESLLFNVDNIKSGREEEDILYEILLKYGIDLNAEINEHNILGKKVYDIAEEVVLCLEEDITLEHIEEIGKLKEEFDVENCRAVFMDGGFRDDVVKTNAIQVLKRYGIEDVKTI